MRRTSTASSSSSGSTPATRRPSAACAIRGLHTYARYVVCLCHTIQVILDPDAIAIGGGISAAPALIEAIHAEEDAMYEGWPFPQMKKPNIVLCEMGNDANIVGAVYEARRRLQL